MSLLGDLVNRIRGLFNNQSRLPEGIQQEAFVNQAPVVQEGAMRDTIYEASLDQNYMQRYERIDGYGAAEQRYFQNPRTFENQISLVDIVSQMEANGYMDEFMSRREFIINNSSLYSMQQVHGVDHTSRVTLYAEMLSMVDNLPEHTRHLILTAAQLHDIGRVNDNIAYDHGIAGAEKIEQLGLINNFSKEDKLKVEFAVASHSMSRDQVDFIFNERSMSPQMAQETMQKYVAKYGETFIENYNRIQRYLPRDLSPNELASYREVLTYLQDADKLDRARIANKNMQIDPTRLTHDSARRLLKVARQNFFNYDKLIERQYSRDTNSLFNQVYNGLRSQGVNISYKDFTNIMKELKPEALEYAVQSGDVRNLLTFDTYKAYGKPLMENGYEAQPIIPDQIFSEITAREQTSLLRSTFDSEYMLFHTLKRNNPEGYSLLTYTAADSSMYSMIGTLGQFTYADYQKFNDAMGKTVRLTDFLQLSSGLTPEQYREVFDNGNYMDLISTKYEPNSYGLDHLRRQLSEKGINLPDDYVQANYKLIDEIAYACPEFLKGNEFKDVSLIEMYSSFCRLINAGDRLKHGQYVSNDFEFNEKTIGEFARFTKQSTRKISPTSKTISVNYLDEETQMDVAREFAINKDDVINPAYLEYMAKNDKPYTTKNPKEMIEYTRYCIDHILVDNDISLDDAKNKLLHTLFNIEVPKEFVKDFEKEAIKSLETHKACMKNSPFYSTKKDVISNMIDLFKITDIDRFKDALYASESLLASYHTAAIGEQVKQDLAMFSKKDIAFELQNSANNIKSSPSYRMTAQNGEVVTAKVLNGQDFCMAISTHMPKCSSVANKLIANRGREGIIDSIFNRSVNPNDRCTTVVDQDMFAHSEAMLQDQELVYGYVPKGPQNIGIAATHDLSSVKRPGGRITKMAVKFMSCRGLTSGTTEEHNEVVMNDVYPDFIVCFDKIDEVAVKRQQQLNDMYKQMGLSKKVELVFVDAKQTYIPRNQMGLQQRFNYINQRLDQNTFTQEDFNEFFGANGTENDIVLKTMQAIHNTSYRDDVYNPNYARSVLEQVTSIIERVADRVPIESARVLRDKADILIERGSDEGSGTRFYDHSYKGDIPVDRLRNVSYRMNQMAHLIETRTGKNELGGRPSSLTYGDLEAQQLPTFVSDITADITDEVLTLRGDTTENVGPLKVENINVAKKNQRSMDDTDVGIR